MFFFGLKKKLFVQFYSGFSKTIEHIIQRTTRESVMLKAKPRVKVEFESRANVWVASTRSIQGVSPTHLINLRLLAAALLCSNIFHSVWFLISLLNRVLYSVFHDIKEPLKKKTQINISWTLHFKNPKVYVYIFLVLFWKNCVAFYFTLGYPLSNELLLPTILKQSW